MHASTTPGGGTKKKMSLSIDAELSETAKHLGINLSQEAERGILQAVKTHQDAQWLRDNAAAIDAYNRRIEKGGLFAEDQRSF